MKKILVIHGPNLNMFGKRDQSIYGSVTFDEINNKLSSLAKELKVDLEIFQSNHEGALIDKIQEATNNIDGILINPGAYAHTSVALRDALADTKKRIVEIHMSNTHKREEFRHISYISGIADAVIVGLGLNSYLFGLNGLVYLLSNS